ncbi:hypothetical protein [Actinokineospora sp. NBRC 105648]|uniref:hypothetical protein n=1 Tax=Actinokineospora sp. NBRC 105648 TaxID=3032206 RepID=UPI0024A3737A|nr:hypothetical protein [Actinokineospora sp. NBRC 105648]GLZ43530.1 hypothetical protein Acsp05_71540 [Actinokineospora sp. NBRC 105648]
MVIDQRKWWLDRAADARLAATGVPAWRLTDHDGVIVAVDGAGMPVLTVHERWRPGVIRHLQAYRADTVVVVAALLEEVALRPDAVPARYRRLVRTLAERVQVTGELEPLRHGLRHPRG